MIFKEIKISYTFIFLVILSIYAAFTAPFLSSGLISNDSHGVINCVNNLVNYGNYVPSRPPGHPSSEIYLFLPLSLFLKGAFNRPFDWFTYNCIQYIGGIFTLLIFFILMKKLTADRIRVAFGSLTLALSTGYLCNSIDGGEFIFSLGCFLAAIYLVIKPPKIAAKGSYSIWVPILLALGTGFRPELILSVGCFYAILFYLQPYKKVFLKNLFLQSIFILLVWLPVLWGGRRMQPPFALEQNFLARFVSVTYKIFFSAFSLPVFIVLCFIFYLGVRKLYDDRQTLQPSNLFIIYLSISAIVINFAANFYYPAKTDFFLITVPFFIVLASSFDSRYWLTILLIATVISTVITIDVMENRKFVGPILKESYYRTFLSNKSKYKLKYLSSVFSRTFEGKKIIVVLDCWRWDLDYNINEKNQLIPLQKEEASDNWVYRRTGTEKAEIFLPRESLNNLALFRLYADEGYKIFADRLVLKRTFFRHQIFQELPDEIKLSGVTFHVF
ncbi:MAG: hypothetical protein M1438_18000 [Deltaproteobacteria bacterium]|nr:hypothetical protein [Deltaproteobacteria bacterium]